MERLPFNRPYVIGTEFAYIEEAIARGHLSGNGAFTRRCAAWLADWTCCKQAFITPSCTAALEMAMLLLDLEPGDEVVMPSFSFVSTANAVVLRGGVPVFVDIRDDTLNLDERLIEEALTERTRAILVVHYAGVGCEMEAIMEIADAHDLVVIEDAAHGLGSSLNGRPLGSFGHLAALSFHETKNVHSGEGGALLVNDASFVERAEVLQEKGTDRSRFFRGEVDKYTWCDVGSSFLLSEITAAFLWAQLEQVHFLTSERRAVWRAYHEAFEALERGGAARRPVVSPSASSNGHMYYLMLGGRKERDALIQALDERDIHAVFHYVPLHSSPAGSRYGRAQGDLPVTRWVSDGVIRLPLWVGMPHGSVERVAGVVYDALAEVAASPAGSD